MLTLPEPKSGTKRPKLTTPKNDAFAIVIGVVIGKCEISTTNISQENGHSHPISSLASAGSRKFCLRLLGCQPGCTIVYCHFKICAYFRELVLKYFDDNKLYFKITR